MCYELRAFLANTVELRNSKGTRITLSLPCLGSKLIKPQASAFGILYHMEVPTLGNNDIFQANTIKNDVFSVVFKQVCYQILARCDYVCSFKSSTFI